MLARNALRLAAELPTKTTTHDLPQLARLLSRTLLAPNASHTPTGRALSRAYVAALSSHRRTYATTTRATSATKPTATVKKAVKAQAAKKPATKKTPAKKTAATKAKKKPGPKPKKAVAKKAAPKKPVKKVLTPEAKVKAKEAKAHADVLALKKRALVEPVTTNQIRALNIFIGESCKGVKSASGEGAAAVRSGLSDAAKKYSNLTPAELEHYNHLANERTRENRKTYETWLHSFTVEQIQDANLARAALRRKFKGTKSRYLTNTSKIQDDRAPKRPLNPYSHFYVERFATGDFKGIKTVEAAKLIGAEWKALSEGEKKKYQELAEEDKARYKAAQAA